MYAITRQRILLKIDFFGCPPRLNWLALAASLFSFWSRAPSCLDRSTSGNSDILNLSLCLRHHYLLVSSHLFSTFHSVLAPGIDNLIPVFVENFRADFGFVICVLANYSRCGFDAIHSNAKWVRFMSDNFMEVSRNIRLVIKSNFRWNCKRQWPT